MGPLRHHWINGLNSNLDRLSVYPVRYRQDPHLLAASVSIFLPPIGFIVHRKRDALPKLAICIRHPSGADLSYFTKETCNVFRVPTE
jgi:hypothetical protein